MIIVKNPKNCTRCLICELVCSFHHIRKYSRSQSSIKVNKSIFDQEKEPQISISYIEESGNRPCDLCNNEEAPLCIRFCPENVLGSERS